MPLVFLNNGIKSRFSLVFFMVGDGLMESPYEKMVLVDDVDVTSDTM